MISYLNKFLITNFYFQLYCFRVYRVVSKSGKELKLKQEFKFYENIYPRFSMWEQSSSMLPLA